MSEKVIKLLNDARKRELLAILQYMAEHYELEDQGYGKIGDELKKIAIVEMKHAEELAERILFLGGVPTTELEAKVQKGLSIKDMLKVDIHLEEGAIKMYNDAANACAQEGDHVSKAVFESLLGAEDGHLDDFQKKLDHVEKLGDVYLTTLLD